MNTIISDLRSQGKWYIVPDGNAWGDELKAHAAGLCSCGHPIEHSYFACLVVGGEVIQTVEVGSSCVIDLTHGYIYKEACTEWVYLTDDQMSSLFWLGHKVGLVGDLYPEFKKNPVLAETCKQVAHKEINRFYVGLYDFAINQYVKNGFARLTAKQFNSISDKI